MFASHHPHLRGVAYVLFSVLVWSGWMVFSSHSVKGTLTAYDLTALRFGVAGLVMLPVLIKLGFRVGPWGMGSGILLAALMGAPYNTIAIAGMRYAPVSHIGIINTCMLISTTLGGVLLLRERTNWLRMLGVVISISGIVCFLVANSTADGQYPQLHYGHAHFAIAGLMWTGYALLVRRWGVSPLHATAAVCVYSALFYLPFYFTFATPNINATNLDAALFQALYQGILNSVLALLCYNRAIALIGATTSSAFLPLIPVIATLAAIPFMHEIPTSLEWLGIALAGFGVLLSIGALELLAFRIRGR